MEHERASFCRTDAGNQDAAFCSAGSAISAVGRIFKAAANFWTIGKEGVLRPCSMSRMYRKETPDSSDSWRSDRPLLVRITSRASPLNFIAIGHTLQHCAGLCQPPLAYFLTEGPDGLFMHTP